MFISSGVSGYLWLLNTIWLFSVHLFLMYLWLPRLELFLKYSYFRTVVLIKLFFYKKTKKRVTVLDISNTEKGARVVVDTSPYGEAKEVALFHHKSVGVMFYLMVHVFSI